MYMYVYHCVLELLFIRICRCIDLEFYFSVLLRQSLAGEVLVMLRS